MNCLEYGAQAHVLDLPMGDERVEEAKIRHRRDKVRQDQTALKLAQKDTDDDELPRYQRRAGRTMRRGGY